MDVPPGQVPRDEAFWATYDAANRGPSTPSREDIARLLWDVSEGQVLRIPWEHVAGGIRARFERMANAVRAVYAPRCCDSHGRLCEPPSDLCCGQCVEAGHRLFDGIQGQHTDGSVCVNPMLSANVLPEREYNPHIHGAAKALPDLLRAELERRLTGMDPGHPIREWAREQLTDYLAQSNADLAITTVTEVDRGPVRYPHTEQT